MFYRTIKITLILLMIGSMMFPVSEAFSEGFLPEKAEGLPDVSVSTSFLTKYIWRGQNLGNEPVMQVDASLSKYGFTLDVWGNYSLAHDKTLDSGRYQEFTELDYTASYEFSVGDALAKLGMDTVDILEPLSIKSGYTFYTFPNLDLKEKGSYSHETILGVSYDTLLQPYITWYWDVEAGKGSYLQFGGGHTFELGNGITSSIGTAFAYNDKQWTNKSGWSDVLVKADVSIPVLEYFMVTPQVAYSVILDRETYSDAESNEFYGGISVGFAY